MAAGAVTTTEVKFGPVKKVKFAWTAGTSASSGTVTTSTSAAYDGKIVALVTVPAGGGDAPSASYDITVKDGSSVDVLLGAGASRAAAATEYVKGASLGAVAASKLKLTVTNAGAANKGTAYLFITGFAYY